MPMLHSVHKSFNKITKLLGRNSGKTIYNLYKRWRTLENPRTFHKWHSLYKCWVHNIYISWMENDSGLHSYLARSGAWRCVRESVGFGRQPFVPFWRFHFQVSRLGHGALGKIRVCAAALVLCWTCLCACWDILIKSAIVSLVAAV